MAVPGYYNLLAHQPNWVVVDDAKNPPVTQNISSTQNLSLAIPKADSQGPRLESTVPNPTSFPPSYAFFIMIPYALIIFLLVACFAWLGQSLLRKN